MLTKEQIFDLKPSPRQPKTRLKIKRGEDGKPILGVHGNIIRYKKPVMTFAPELGKYVPAMKRDRELSVIVRKKRK